MWIGHRKEIGESWRFESLVETNRFRELSRISRFFPGLSSPGKCNNKIPRLSRTRTNPVNGNTIYKTTLFYYACHTQQKLLSRWGVGKPQFWLETGKLETLSDRLGGNDCGNSTCAVHLTAEELQAIISTSGRRRENYLAESSGKPNLCVLNSDFNEIVKRVL